MTLQSQAKPTRGGPLVSPGGGLPASHAATTSRVTVASGSHDGRGAEPAGASTDLRRPGADTTQPGKQVDSKQAAGVYFAQTLSPS